MPNAQELQGVKVLDHRTAGKWLPVAAGADVVPAPPFTGKFPLSELQRTLSDAALSQHLAVLAGLGPSVAVGGPTMADLWNRVKEANGERFDKVREAVTYPAEQNDIEAFLTRCQLERQLRPNAELNEFITSAENVIASSCSQFVKPDTELVDHETLLRKIARRPAERSRARFFTTNYDLCFEHAARATGFVVIDGFGYLDPPLFDASNFDVDLVRRHRDDRPPEYLEGVIHLLKLHGSVNWEERSGEIVRQPNPKTPLIIFPRADKYEVSYRQPFIELFGRFHNYLRQPHLGLLAIGFGFADAHLSESILGAVQRNVSLKIVVATRDCETQSSDKGRRVLGALAKLAADGDPRICLIDIPFGRLVELFPDLGRPSEGSALRELLSRALATK